MIDPQHVGSTSVPGLAAKPIIDVDLLVEDSADEPRYLPALEQVGYTLVLREPRRHGCRMLVDDAEAISTCTSGGMSATPGPTTVALPDGQSDHCGTSWRCPAREYRAEVPLRRPARTE